MKTLKESLLGDMETAVNSKYIYYPKSKNELVEAIKTCLDAKIYDLNCIDTSKITEINFVFDTEYGPLKQYKNVFSKIDISKWNVSNVENMSYTFAFSQFNGDISKWDVSNVKDMEAMFKESKFNQDISGWDVSNVENMHDMFDNSNFNQDISNWDVSNNRHFETMFKHSKFNQDISKWPINPNVYFSRMFYGSDFNQNLSNWKISRCTPKYLSEMFKHTPMQDKKEFYPKRK